MFDMLKAGSAHVSNLFADAKTVETVQSQLSIMRFHPSPLANVPKPPSIAEGAMSATDGQRSFTPAGSNPLAASTIAPRRSLT